MFYLPELVAVVEELNQEGVDTDSRECENDFFHGLNQT